MCRAAGGPRLTGGIVTTEPARTGASSAGHRWAHRIAGLPSGRRTKWAVLLFWVIVIALTGSLAGKLMGAEKNDASAYLPASAESTQALKLQDHFTSKNLNPAVVVYVRPSGLTRADLAKISADAKQFAALKNAGKVVGPIPSGDRKAAQVLIEAHLGFSSAITNFVNRVHSIGSSGDPGLHVYVTGPAASAADSVKIFKGIDSTLLYATLGVVIVLLLLTYRSPILWLLPIMSAGVSLIAAEAVIYELVVHEGLVVNGQTAGILVVLVLGASTDYALLLIARYREELRRHEDRHEAMAVAMRRAGPAIFASGLTVIAAMLCLLAADSADISGLGPVAAIGVGVGLLAMITLLPALLVITGRWVFWPLRPRYGSQDPTSRGPWSRIGSRIARRPRQVWIVTAVLLAVATLGLIGLRFGALTQAQSYRGTPSAVAGERVLAQHFPAGAGEPVYVIGDARQAAPLRSALAGTRGIASVSPPQVKDGLVLLQGTLAVPPDSQAAYTVVSQVRTAVHAIPGADAKVGGSTAINADVQHYAIRDRNVIIPLILIGTVILSFGAALGLSALVFRHVFGFAGADNSMPLFAFVFLVALGIDYNIFLMTRVREESLKSGTHRGMLAGLAATGGVITAAGLVLAGTFATLATLPLVILTEIGFTVALGVLLDTLVVRSVLVTALTLDVGRHMWWPSRLATRRDDDVAAAPPGELTRAG